MARWKDISANKSTNECVDVLLNEIAAGGGSDAGGAEYFDAKVNFLYKNVLCKCRFVM